MKYKTGDRVVKARPYDSRYCRFGGEENEVPIGTEGTITSVDRYDKCLNVHFDNGTSWGVDQTELRLIPKIVSSWRARLE